MKLGELVRRLGGSTTLASEGPEILDVRLDSREVRLGDLFVALPGSRADGAAFVADALARGAVAVLTPHELDLRTVISDMPGLCVATWTHARARRVAGLASALVQGEPVRGMAVAGVTGTNGKTTTAHLLGEILARGGRRPAVLGTAGHSLAGGLCLSASHTTPDAPELWRILAEHRRRGGDSVVMEVSSHALDQERTAGLAYDVAIFTNLTREHLDYHRDMPTYARAKERLFEGLRPGAAAVLNLDDAYWVQMGESARRAGARVLTYSTKGGADLVAQSLVAGPQGMRCELHGLGLVGVPLHLPLHGRYNVENALAAAAAALVLGVPPELVVASLAVARGAPGRLERATPPEHPFQAFVDYAHSPDALERVLVTLRAGLAGRAGARLIVVFGCGGDRDAGKRPQMGRVAAQLADRVWITSDNPRSEEPARIVSDIRAGIPAEAAVAVELDRRAAIRAALAEARPGDVVLVAGKGHETVQWIAGKAHAFDDRQVVQEALA